MAVEIDFIVGKNGKDINRYPLVMTNSLLLKMTIEIVEFPIENGDFP